MANLAMGQGCTSNRPANPIIQIGIRLPSPVPPTNHDETDDEWTLVISTGPVTRTSIADGFGRVWVRVH
jgi:hypothetical protein